MLARMLVGLLFGGFANFFVVAADLQWIEVDQVSLRGRKISLYKQEWFGVSIERSIGREMLVSNPGASYSFSQSNGLKKSDALQSLRMNFDEHSAKQIVLNNRVVPKGSQFDRADPCYFNSRALS